MNLYHTETQEDYNALMIELEGEGYKWNEVEKATENYAWDVFKDNTVVIKECDADLGFASKGYCERIYIDTPIQKYKAKLDKIAKYHDDAANIAHYTAGGIETLDYIKAKVKDYPSYTAGNILKYVSHYEHKNGIEDLKKAQFHLNDLIEWMESD
ncbi:DUF3310 domain-containing protein [Listeria welshimeri]|nr:DUF3310 domain-containing protein [Listeria welshimeri]